MGGVDSWFAKDEKLGPLSRGWSTEFDVARMDGAHRNSSTKFEDLNSFSSSLPSVFHQALNISSNGDRRGSSELTVEDGLEPLNGDMVSHAIGDLLPDDEEELLAGIITGFDSIHVDNKAAEENEDFDLFSNLGGLEMDGELQDSFGGIHITNRSKVPTDGYSAKLSMDGFYGVGAGFQGSANGPGSVVGEHPFGEHPSRTLFVRNINSNVEDSELRALFEHYGDIRTLYTACKHRGFVMISYYDIRAAKSAMRALQNKPLRRRKLDIHFSIPKDNPSDKDLNQGTLVVFNLDSSVSNDDLRHIFGQYGEVKEIRETPHKCHHKFIEFFDVRAAEAALRALNRSDIAGKRIKLEPSRPGGARRSWMQHINQDPDQDDARMVWPQSSPPVSNSPLGHLPSWGHFGSPLESGASWSARHSYGMPMSSTSKASAGLSNSLHSNPIHVRTIGNHFGWNNQNDASVSLLHTSLSGKGIHSHHAHSLPEHRNGVNSYNPASLIPPMGMRPMQSQTRVVSDSEGLRIPRAGSGILKTGGSQQLKFSSHGNVSLSDSQFFWDSSNTYEQNLSPVTWTNSPLMSQASNPPPFTGSFDGFHCHFTSASYRHQVGSAPSGDSSFMDRQFGGLQPPADATGLTASQAESLNVLGCSGADLMANGGGNSHGVSSTSIGSDVLFQSGGLGLISHRNLVFPAHGLPVSSSFDMLSFDRWRLQQPESSTGQIAENKSQYQLDIDRILRGEDNRTTLMIKNIPNKYTSKMLLAAIDENHRGMYDFLYLPIDFKNKCNVGYAFINMTSPNHIISLYQAFNGKKWEKFNSEKVASLAYARIQGKTALVAHFQNSSLMNEDKRCRPILFHSSGSETGEQQELLEMGMQGTIRDLAGLNNYEFSGDRDRLASGNPVTCSSAVVDPSSE